MWTKKENTYNSTDVNYQGGVKYGSDIHHVTVKTNQVVWDMIKVLDQKGLYGFHFSAKLGTQKTIINIKHENEEMLHQAKQALIDFEDTKNMLFLYKTEPKEERNYVKIAIILLSFLGSMALIGTGIGYYLYTQTDFFKTSSLSLSTLKERSEGEPQTIEVDIQTLNALKESFEKQEKSEMEKDTEKAMVIATGMISQMVPDSLKAQYSSEAVVQKFKDNGGVNLVLKDANRSDGDFNRSVTELNRYAMDFVKENDYDKALKLYQKVADNNETNQSARMESYADQGELYEKRAEWDQAKKSYQKSLTHSQSLAKADPIRYSNTEAWNQTKLAKMNQESNQTQEAEAAYQQSEAIYLKTIKLFTGLAKKDPKTHQQNLAWAYNMLANFYHYDRQDYNQAIQARQEALKIYKILVKQEPKRFFERLFRTYNSLALSYQEQKQYTLTQKVLQKSLELIQTVSKKTPTKYHRYVADILKQLGVLYIQMEQLDQAHNYLHQSKSYYKKLVFKDNKHYQPYLLEVQQNIASLEAAKKDYPKALRLYETVLTAYEKLNHTEPLRYNAPIAKILNCMAWTMLQEEKQIDTESIHALLMQSLKTSKALEQIDHAAYRSLSSTSHIHLAYLSLRQGSMLEAFEHYEEALRFVKNYETTKSYLLFLIAKKNILKADAMFKSMLQEYTVPEQQAELWMLYGQFYMQIDAYYAKQRLENALELYQEINDTVKIEALKELLKTVKERDQNLSN